MRKSKKYFIFIGILLSIIFIYFSYPKSGSFDNLIFKVVEKESITGIKITKYGDLYKRNSIEDTERIHDVISKLSNLDIIEYRKDLPADRGNSYDIAFSNKGKYIYLGISLYDTGYFKVFTGEPSYIKYKTYKIIDGLDIEYIESLLSPFF